MSEVSLKEYTDRQIAALEKTLCAKILALERAVSKAYSSSERALDKAELIVDRRLESMNEFRAAMKDQAGEFLTRKEHQVQLASITDKLDALQARLDKSEGRGGGMQALWGWIAAAISTLGALVALVALVLKLK